jgi:hypothetical protein
VDEAALWATRLQAADPVNYLSLFVLGLADRASGRADVALSRYLQAYPQLRAPSSFVATAETVRPALATARLLQLSGQLGDAEALLQACAKWQRSVPRMGIYGYGFMDAVILTLRGDKPGALRALREAEQAGVRPFWWIYRDHALGFDTLREDPEFQAIFADIERDMAAQRAELQRSAAAN